MTAEYRLYQELAEWWPLISPPEDYAEEATYLAGALSSAAVPVREVLDLGSGGGDRAAHPKEGVTIKPLGPSPEIVAGSRRAQPRRPHPPGGRRAGPLGRPLCPGPVAV